MACKMQQFDFYIANVLGHLMVSLWHNEGWGLLLGEEGEVKDVGDGHLPGLGVDHLRRHSRLHVIILQWSEFRKNCTSRDVNSKALTCT